MPGMFQANIRALPRINPDYRNVVEYGIVAGRKIICWSENHVNRHANNQLTKGSFEAPCLIRASTFVALDTALTTIRYAISPGTGEVALKDSPYEINPLAIKNVLRSSKSAIASTGSSSPTPPASRKIKAKHTS